MSPAARLPTSYAQADRQINQLKQHQLAWLTVDRPSRIAYLKACLPGMLAVAQPWVDAACPAKAIDPRTALAGEEWLVGPATVVSYIQQLIKTLAGSRPIALHVKPSLPEWRAGEPLKPLSFKHGDVKRVPAPL